jgi:hypothetical protein
MPWLIGLQGRATRVKQTMKILGSCSLALTTYTLCGPAWHELSKVSSEPNPGGYPKNVVQILKFMIIVDMLTACDLKSQQMSAFLSGIEGSGWVKHIKSVIDAAMSVARYDRDPCDL